jgi:hypothetical protein
MSGTCRGFWLFPDTYAVWRSLARASEYEKHFNCKAETISAFKTETSAVTVVVLRSRHSFPPNGFTFYQAETGWEAPAWQSFDVVVQNIIQHRKANPRFNLSTDPNIVAQELDAYNTERLKRMPGGNEYLLHDGGAPPNFPIPRRQSQSPGGRVAAALVKARNALAGIGLWMDWFGDSPVASSTATQRASVCVRCPQNIRGDVFQKFNAKSGEELLKIFTSLKDQELSTPYDEQLGVCAVCDCPMKAKVWAPIEIITKHLRPEVRPGLWGECWIISEESSVSA